MYRLGLILFAVGTPVGLAALFLWQNHARTVDLSFDLWVGAWHLASEVSVSALIAICTIGGFVIGAGLMGMRSLSAGRRITQLERELAMSSFSSGASKPSPSSSATHNTPGDATDSW